MYSSQSLKCGFPIPPLFAAAANPKMISGELIKLLVRLQNVLFSWEVYEAFLSKVQIIIPESFRLIGLY
jgi:hypothetical protein